MFTFGQARRLAIPFENNNFGIKHLTGFKHRMGSQTRGNGDRSKHNAFSSWKHKRWSTQEHFTGCSS